MILQPLVVSAANITTRVVGGILGKELSPQIQPNILLSVFWLLGFVDNVLIFEERLFNVNYSSTFK